MAKKPKHGGAREGSGRPALYKKTISVRVTEAAYQRLTERATEAGHSVTAEAAQILEEAAR